MANTRKFTAEMHFARAQRARDASKAMTEAEAEARRIDENTKRLRALRLAKEAADAAEATDRPPPAKKKARAAPAPRRARSTG